MPFSSLPNSYTYSKAGSPSLEAANGGDNPCFLLLAVGVCREIILPVACGQKSRLGRPSLVASDC